MWNKADIAETFKKKVTAICWCQDYDFRLLKNIRNIAIIHYKMMLYFNRRYGEFCCQKKAKYTVPIIKNT